MSMLPRKALRVSLNAGLEERENGGISMDGFVCVTFVPFTLLISVILSQSSTVLERASTPKVWAR